MNAISKAKMIITGNDPDCGWLHYLLGAIVGIVSTPLIWMAIIFGIIYPLDDFLSHNLSHFPLYVWYGSWILTILLLYIAFLWLRKKVPLFACTFFFFSCLMSVPLLLLVRLESLFPWSG